MCQDDGKKCGATPRQKSPLSYQKPFINLIGDNQEKDLNSLSYFHTPFNCLTLPINTCFEAKAVFIHSYISNIQFSSHSKKQRWLSTAYSEWSQPLLFCSLPFTLIEPPRPRAVAGSASRASIRVIWRWLAYALALLSCMLVINVKSIM